jgi:hypothetical protein
MEAIEQWVAWFRQDPGLACAYGALAFFVLGLLAFAGVVFSRNPEEHRAVSFVMTGSLWLGFILLGLALLLKWLLPKGG